MKRIFLVDGSQLVYRSHFAFIGNPLRSSKTGEVTSATFGFARALKKLLEENPEFIGVVFDSKAPTFRHEQYREYKATRPAMPEELASQLPRIKEIVDAFSVYSVEIPGYEADDVIGTLAKAASGQGMEVILVSGDKDFLQLISSSVRLLIPGKSGGEASLVGEKEVLEKYGISPDQVVDMMSLAGDAVDNVPGIKGIGEKTALTLVKRYGSLDVIFESNLSDESLSLREKLAKGREDAFLSRDLVRIRCDAPVSFDLEKLSRKPPDERRLSILADELEFRWLKEFAGGVEYVTGEDEVVDEERAGKVLESLRGAKAYALSLHTTEADPMKGSILGIALSHKPGRAFYFPVSFPAFESHGGMLDALHGQVLSDNSSLKVGHNLKDNLILLENSGVYVSGQFFDISVASYILNPGTKTDLGFLLESRNLGRLKMEKNQNIEESHELTCRKADSILRVFEVLETELKAEKIEGTFRELEMPLLFVLKDMQKTGVHIDREFLKQMSDELLEGLSAVEDEIYRLSGLRFNLNSPQQLSHVLFEKHGLPKGRRTKKSYSTDSDVLETLAVSHDLPRKILDYRQLYKLKSTYVDALPLQVNEKTGRVHASFNQTVTATGRLSSSEPNLQNIPFRGELGRKIRKAFTAEKPGWVILSADYSQIELRILAHLSSDENLLRAFRNGEDIHKITASRIFDVEPELVSEDMRGKAKVVNFGVIYGMSPFGLSKELRISRARAAQFIEKFFENYGGVKRFIENLLDEARKDGAVRTMTGRKRYLPEIKSKNERLKAEAERAAINTPIQGSAADIIKKAMIDISKEFQTLKIRARLILQIHDELLFELPEDEIHDVEPLVKSVMENAVFLSVPIEVRTGYGRSWYEAH